MTKQDSPWDSRPPYSSSKYQQLLSDRPDIREKVESGGATKEQVIEWMKSGGDAQRKNSAKGWSKGFRGLASFDLSTGLLIPFTIATSCVVIAASSQFHARPAPGLLGETDANGQTIVAPGHIQDSYNRLISARNASIRPRMP